MSPTHDVIAPARGGSTHLLLVRQACKASCPLLLPLLPLRSLLRPALRCVLRVQGCKPLPHVPPILLSALAAQTSLQLRGQRLG